MLDRDEVEQLQLTADYRNACKDYRSTNVLGLISCVVSICFGIPLTLGTHPAHVGLIVIGSLLLISTVWLTWRPNAIIAIANAIFFILGGLWIVIALFLELGVAGKSQPLVFVAGGIFMIAAGGWALAQYKRHATALWHGATANELQRLSSLMKAVLEASDEDDDIVPLQMVARKYSASGLLWGLFGTTAMACFAGSPRRDLC